MKRRTKIFISAFAAAAVTLQGFFPALNVLPAYAAPQGTDKFAEDFDAAAEVPDGLFGELKNCSEYKVITEDFNNYLYISKDETKPAAASAGRGFEGVFEAENGYAVEFSASFTVAKSKVLRLLDENEDEILKMEFGKASGNSLQDGAVDLPDNTDGEFHSYKIVVNPSGTAELYYDGAKLEGDFSAYGSADMKALRFMIAGGRGENSICLDNIAVYALNDPVTAAPVISVDRENNKIELTAEENSKIYYTTDRSYPTENSRLYIGKIDITDGMYIRAAAFSESGSKSFGVYGGPYSYYIKPEEPIEPQLDDGMYIEDFENRDEVSDFLTRPGYVFDADYGLSAKRKIVKENNNKYAVISRSLSGIDTDAWLQHTFPEGETYEGSYVFEFSAKQTAARPKLLRFSSSAGDAYYFDLSFGSRDSGTVGGKAVELPNNLDGKFHDYKLVIHESGEAEFYYDGEKADGKFSIAADKVLKKYRFSLGGRETEGEQNELSIDNICVSRFSAPFPSMPQFSVKSGEVEYNSEIELSADEDCAIFYTLDGSYPEFIPENKYRAPIVIDSADMYIKAVAVRENGNYSACAIGGAYTPINENGIVRLTENPFRAGSAGAVDGAYVDLCSLEDGLEITLVLALYKGDKLLGGIKTQEYTLSKGVNPNLTVSADREESADIARLYIWNRNSGDFKPLTDCWELK